MAEQSIAGQPWAEPHPSMFPGLVWVDKDRLSGPELDKITRKLVVTPRVSQDIAFGDGKDSEPRQIFVTSGNKIGLPRAFAMAQGYCCWSADPHLEGEAREITPGLTFHGTLRDYQEGKTKEIVTMLRHAGGCTLVAKCGTGKTVMALWTVVVLNLPTLVLVHTEDLKRQWTERIREFVRQVRVQPKLLLDDVDEVPVKVGSIQGDKVDIQPITVAMIESLAARDYPQEIYSHFGLVVSDEAHRLGAATWSRAAWRFDAPHLLALSATPNRSDGMDVAFREHIGWDTVVVTAQGMTGRVWPVLTGVEVRGKRFYRHWEDEPRVIDARVISFLAEHKERNQLLMKLIDDAAAKGRRILVLSARRKQLEWLLRNCESDVALFVGGMKDGDRAYARGRQVMLATDRMAKEALDIPELDTLLLATPCSGITQQVGRIERLHEGKKEPFVIDPVDEGEPPGMYWSRRRPQYERLGWDVQGFRRYKAGEKS